MVHRIYGGSKLSFWQVKMAKKKRSGNFLKHFNDYCLNTTLHGLRYVGTTELSLKERLFFGLAFIFVVIVSSYFIGNVYTKWRENPMIIGMSATLSNSKDFPFPAVTICNMNQAKESKVRTIERFIISSTS